MEIQGEHRRGYRENTYGDTGTTQMGPGRNQIGTQDRDRGRTQMGTQGEHRWGYKEDSDGDTGRIQMGPGRNQIGTQDRDTGRTQARGKVLAICDMAYSYWRCNVAIL